MIFADFDVAHDFYAIGVLLFQMPAVYCQLIFAQSHAERFQVARSSAQCRLVVLKMQAYKNNLAVAPASAAY